MRSRPPARRSPDVVPRLRLADFRRPPRRGPPHHRLYRKEPPRDRPPGAAVAFRHPVRHLALARRPQSEFALRQTPPRRRPILMSAPLATHDYTPGALDAALEFLKRT